MYLYLLQQVYLEVAASEEYEIQGEVGYGLCVPPGGKAAVKQFQLNFLALGDVNITVTASARDGYCDQGNTVKPGR